MSLFYSLFKAIGLQTDRAHESDITQNYTKLRLLLQGERLLVMEWWAGYTEFLQWTSPEYPPDRARSADSYTADSVDKWRLAYQKRGERYEMKHNMKVWFLAFHYPTGAKDKDGGRPLATIYRWEIVQAWETLRQITLTRTLILLLAQQEPPMSDWTRPDDRVIPPLKSWVMIAKREFERLDRYFLHMAYYELSSRYPPPDKWLFEDSTDALPETLHVRDYKECPIGRFPFPIFSRCKRINEGEDILSDSASDPAAGLIRALVQHYQLYEPIGTDCSALSGWREWKLKLDKNQHRDWSGHPGLTKFKDDLNIRSAYAKEVERWLLSPALRQTTAGIPESDSAEEIVEPFPIGPPSVAAAQAAEESAGD